MKEVEDVLEQNKQQQYKEYQYQPRDFIVDTEMAIKNAQIRMWKALRAEPEITLSMERTNDKVIIKETRHRSLRKNFISINRAWKSNILVLRHYTL